MSRILFLIVVFFSIAASAQQESPFNRIIVDNTENDTYSFLISGHFYGGSSNSTHYPTNTLLANLDWINSTDASMLICLGDLFKDISNEIPQYKSSFFNKLNIPLFNAVGNHDLTGDIYQENFGATFFYFHLNGDLHCVLDTEINNGDIINDQLKMIQAIAKICKENVINNVFFYAHRTVWKNSYQELDGLFVENTQGIGDPNFKSDILPILDEISDKAEVFWFAGSLGPAPASFFYFEDTENEVTYIATAIRGLLRDALLAVDIDKGKVSFRPVSLTGQDLEPIEFYNVPYWNENVGVEPFNWRLFPYYVQLMLTHWYFWLGGLFGALLIVVIIFFKRKFSKRKLI